MKDLNQLNKTDIYFIIIKNFNTIYLRCYVEIKEEKETKFNKILKNDIEKYLMNKTIIIYVLYLCIQRKSYIKIT